jgi:potassium efflux system protein
VTERKALLEQAVESDDFFLRKLGELESAQQRLLAMIQRFDAFLDQHLLWVRSASRAELKELGALPADVSRILSPTGWYTVARAFAYQATHSPVFILLAVALGVLLWSRKRLIGFIQGIGSKLGNPATDRFGYSLQALAAGLIAAAAWPLVMAVAGWQLKVSVEATGFSNAVGDALLALATQFYLLRALRVICIPRGLAAAHLCWPEQNLRALRRELDWLTLVFLPSAGVALVAVYLDPLNAGWAIGRLAFLILVASLALAFFRLLHPGSGVLAGYLGAEGRQTFLLLSRLLYPLLIAAPLLLGGLSLLGYFYTAGTLLENLVETIWMFTGLIVTAGLAQRWLLVSKGALEYEAAIEQYNAGQDGVPDPEHDEEPKSAEAADPAAAQVDLKALSDTSLELINTAVILSGLVGLWVIWSEVVPALRVWEAVTLWHQTVTVDGEQRINPVTLADLGLAVIYAAITLLLAKKLPAMLEILLLQYTEMSAGGRYTATTLTNYAIVTVGAVLVFKTIGADWSQLQWLVAALGVGIGFGLQEIVANFISGVILLFERPIRVGDVVTVGETDGTVTRIRSRATTIRGWDGKELLVPNKEFITGRLLNWSLSDQATRVVLSVGIAYGSDVRRAMELLEEAARENDNVLASPAPSVIFETFGDNSLGLLLRCFVDSAELCYPTISALNEAINNKLNAAGISIAFPQRDLHLDTISPLRVQIERLGTTD